MLKRLFSFFTLLFYLLTQSCGDDPSYRGSGEWGGIGTSDVERNQENTGSQEESETKKLESNSSSSNQAKPTESENPVPSPTSTAEMTCREKFNVTINPVFTTNCIGCHGFIPDFRITQNEEANFSIYESAFIGSEDEMIVFFSENGNHGGGPQATMSESLLLEMKDACD